MITTFPDLKKHGSCKRDALSRKLIDLLYCDVCLGLSDQPRKRVASNDFWGMFLLGKDILVGTWVYYGQEGLLKCWVRENGGHDPAYLFHNSSMFAAV